MVFVSSGKFEAPRADIAHIDPRRLIRDAFEVGDTWFVTGDLAKVDTVGDYWFVDKPSHMILTKQGPVASTRVEDGLYAASCVALCVVTSRKDEDGHEVPVAAVQLAGNLDLADLSAAIQALPEYARPRELRIVDEIPLTDGFRPIKRHAFDTPTGALYRWNTHAQKYETVTESLRTTG
jgi:acyl-CoA synthetase (AMP-forming)/AMP-acid ligase II